MDISVVGAVMHDEIVTPDGRTRSSFGGILYNVLALCTITRPTDYIRPFCQIGADHIETLTRQCLSRHGQIDQSHVRVNPRGTDTNRLVYRSASARDERMTIHSDPFDPERLLAAAGSDAVLVNYINGTEVPLETLRWLRRNMRGMIHLDIHNLGRVPGGGRFDAWPDWVENVDVVQFNEWEAERFFGEVPSTPPQQEQAVLRFLSVRGPRAAVLTLGEGGCLLGHVRPDGGIRLVRVPAIKPETVVDTTGCGDCFSAGFVVGWLRWRSFPKAALLAVTLSSLKTRLFGLQELASLRDVVGAMQRQFGDTIARIDSGWDGEPEGSTKAP